MNKYALSFKKMNLEASLYHAIFQFQKHQNNQHQNSIPCCHCLNPNQIATKAVKVVVQFLQFFSASRVLDGLKSQRIQQLQVKLRWVTPNVNCVAFSSAAAKLSSVWKKEQMKYVIYHEKETCVHGCRYLSRTSHIY